MRPFARSISPRPHRLRVLCGICATCLIVLSTTGPVLAQQAAAPNPAIGTPPPIQGPSVYSLDAKQGAVVFPYNLKRDPTTGVIFLNPAAKFSNSGGAGSNSPSVTIDYNDGTGNPAAQPFILTLTFTVNGNPFPFKTPTPTATSPPPAPKASTTGGFSYQFDLSDVSNNVVMFLNTRLTSNFDPNTPNFNLGAATITVTPVPNGADPSAPTPVSGALTVTLTEVFPDPNATPKQASNGSPQAVAVGQIPAAQDQKPAAQDQKPAGAGDQPAPGAKQVDDKAPERPVVPAEKPKATPLPPMPALPGAGQQ